MGRPRGARRDGSLLERRATKQTLREECLAQFETAFGRRWNDRLERQILGDGATSLLGILARVETARDRSVRDALNKLRSAARRVARLGFETSKKPSSVQDRDLRTALDFIVGELPSELVASGPPPWVAKMRTLPQRVRVFQTAPGVLGRELEPRELAVVGILAGVNVKLRREDLVGDVLRRERESYASIRARQKR